MADNIVLFDTQRRSLRPEVVILFAIVLIAFGLRLRGIDFGLPSLYDADEPIFVLTALKLLRQGTLNPGWFGHPGTTTIYALALVDIVVLGGGLLLGRFASVDAVGKAMYADPGLVVLPGRYFILVCGLVTILLTFVLAKRLFGTRAGLIAAALLAISPIHIKYSQIIRTDMHETVFLLLCIMSAVNIVRRGKMSDHAWAAIWLGLACATKWPALTVVTAIVGAALWRMTSGADGWRTAMTRLCLAAPIAAAALVIASPYLILDFSTVIANLSAEARNHHPGATGFGFWGNAGWYLSHPLRDAVGLAGLVLAGAGLILGTRRSIAFAVTIIPFLVVPFLSISAQSLIWERWIVPLLPFVAIAVAVAIDSVVSLGKAWTKSRRDAAAAALCLLIVAPLAVAANSAATERTHDTRALATAWAIAHIAPRKTVLVEQLAFDLLGHGWRFLYPVGDAGCIDVAASLRARIPYTTVERWRAGRSVIDIGTIDPARISTCRADYAILENYDRYLREPQTYAAELSVYDALIAEGGVVATLRPERGRIGGPIVRIVRFDQHANDVPIKTKGEPSLARPSSPVL